MKTDNYAISVLKSPGSTRTNTIFSMVGQMLRGFMMNTTDGGIQPPPGMICIYLPNDLIDEAAAQIVEAIAENPPEQVEDFIVFRN